MIGHDRSRSVKVGDQTCALLEHTHKHYTHFKQSPVMTVV